MGTYGWGESSATVAVVEAVAAEAECDADELPTLCDVVDPDALDRFFEVGPERELPGRRVVFEYADFEVAVSGDRRIEVSKADVAATADGRRSAVADVDG
ncbi:hypothetical protein HWV07_07635 [Natronomonas salina]|uniref:HalOD1 output domain-containing protein n=1 Tax=Natronomonas salina TaxID=1710540 RepID=UPI0015B5FA2A|nr:HalOD1 output domain-containing protein [Natronomonas salina]QLD88908.1 hypothetical protein HWV07_07635 [Natronomonas salina]